MSENDENRKLKITFFSLVAAAIVLVIVDSILFLNKKPSVNIPIDQPPTSGEPDTPGESTIFKYAATNSNGLGYEVTLHESGELKIEAGETTNTLTLTGEEIEKVRRIISSGAHSEASLSKALKQMVMGDNIVLKLSDIEDIDDAEYVNFYKKQDLNGDGVVTYRESGNRFLDAMIEELEPSS